MRFTLDNPEDFTTAWVRHRDRWTDRDDRMDLMDKVIRGDWSATGPDDETLENRSPNLVQVAMEDTAEAASLIPSIRLTPSKNTNQAKAKAESMERLGISYFDASEIELLTIRSMMQLSGSGMFSWVCVRDKNGPRIEFRDPRTCYPEADFASIGVTKRCFFARDMYLSQLPEPWQEKFCADLDARQVPREKFYSATQNQQTVTLVEYYDDEQTVVAAVYNATTSPFHVYGSTPSHVSVILETEDNPTKLCPVIVGTRPTYDGEPRGQFDQVVPVMQAHIRLMALVLDYADQAVYSDVWVKDLIGQMSYGGGSYIQLGPQGAIGRVPPAVTSLSVYNELDQLVNNIHLGGRWPKTRPGEIDQAIASAKFVEATAGMMNTVIRTYHLVFKRALEQALRVLFTLDSKSTTTRTVSGVLRNQRFLMDHKPEDIDLEATIRVEYGLGLGRDPAQSMVLGIQASEAGFVSREFVQENFEGITDVGLERARIDTEQFKDMMLAQLLQGLQEKRIPEKALVEIIRQRQNGASLVDLYDKYIVKPAEEAASQMVPLTGGDPMAPGPMQGGPPTAPQAPPPEALMGMLTGGGPPEGGPETIGRLSVPLPGGSGFAGTQTGTA